MRRLLPAILAACLLLALGVASGPALAGLDEFFVMIQQSFDGPVSVSGASAGDVLTRQADGSWDAAAAGGGGGGWDTVLSVETETSGNNPQITSGDHVEFLAAGGAMDAGFELVSANTIRLTGDGGCTSRGNLEIDQLDMTGTLNVDNGNFGILQVDPGGVLRFSGGGGLSSIWDNFAINTTRIRGALGVGTAILVGTPELHLRYTYETEDVTTATNAVTQSETHKVFTNDGTAASAEHDLPPASAAGVTFTFYRQDSFSIVVDPDAGDSFIAPGQTYADGESLTLATDGVVLTVMADADGNWVILSHTGALDTDITEETP